MYKHAGLRQIGPRPTSAEGPPAVLRLHRRLL